MYKVRFMSQGSLKIYLIFEIIYFWKTTEHGGEKKMRIFKENSRMIYCLPNQWTMPGTTDSINEN